MESTAHQHSLAPFETKYKLWLHPGWKILLFKVDHCASIRCGRQFEYDDREKPQYDSVVYVAPEETKSLSGGLNPQCKKFTPEERPLYSHSSCYPYHDNKFRKRTHSSSSLLGNFGAALR